ncbi:MAG: CopD family protein [Flavobacteriales bacterium]|nr:CopD family protein [Flavobacteriales bacterium]
MDSAAAENHALLKALLLIATVTFFAGTFHIVRLFVAHREALTKWEPQRTILAEQFGSLERRALYYLVWPSLIAVVLVGCWLVFQRPGLLKEPSMQVGLGLVSLLAGYHLTVQRVYGQLERSELKWSTLQLRLWAQSATMLLFAVILVALMRDRLTWVWGSLGLVVLGGLLLMAIASVRKSGSAGEDATTGNPRS